MDWDNCITYSFDNTNFMIGQRNSLLQKIQSTQGGQRIISLVALVIYYICVLRKVAKELFVNSEDLVIGIYYHFRRGAKRKNSLLTLIITKLEK